MRSLAAVAAVLLVGLVTACGGSHRHQQQTSGTVVFTTEHGCRESFYAIHPNGRGLSHLFTAGSCSGVYWKPDGTKVLVLEPVGIKLGPYILDLRTGKKQPVPVKGLSESINPPDQPWSPNGKRLLLAAGDSYIRDTDIVYDPRTQYWPSVDDAKATGPAVWASDNRTVLFPIAHGIGAAPLNGPFRRLVNLPRGWSIGALQSSADGKWLSFVKQGRRTSLYVVRPSGQGLRRIAGGVDAASWSPAGERLAYANARGVDVVHLASGHTDEVARAPGAVTVGGQDAPPAWSPDGRWILYSRRDLRYGAPAYDHDQMWTVRNDGRDPHPVTGSFMGSGDIRASAPVWVAASLSGKPVRHPPLVRLRSRPLLTTKLPVVSLGALGDRVAVGTGFGRQPGAGEREVHAPRGPIVLVGRGGRTSQLQPPGYCVTVSSIVLAAAGFGYVCDNSEYEDSRSSLWVGGKELAHTAGGPGFGSFVSGPVTDGRTIAYSVTERRTSGPPTYKQLPSATRIYEARGASARLLRSLRGDETLESVEHGRIALLRYGRFQTVSVLSTHGSAKKFRFHASFLDGVTLDGGRLVAVQNGRLTVVELATGRRHVLRTEFASDLSVPQLESAHGDLIAYVVGAAVHVMRLSDGHEVVLDTPGATDPVLTQFVRNGLYYAYNESYAKRPGRVGFIGVAALERAISTHGRQAR